MTVIATAPKKHIFFMLLIFILKNSSRRKSLKINWYQASLAVTSALGKLVSDLKVMVQRRPRNESAIETIRELGAKVYLFDIIASLLLSIESANINALFNINGALERVISAIALKILGGDIQSKLMPHDEL